MANELPERQAESEEPVYKPKPPLWEPKPAPPLTAGKRVALGLLALVLLGFIAVWLEGSLLKLPTGQTSVTVVRIEAGTPADELPAAFRHLVELPDGSKQTVVLGRIHRPGERLLLTASRGLLTGRVRLGAPYVAVAAPPEPAAPPGDAGAR